MTDLRDERPPDAVEPEHDQTPDEETILAGAEELPDEVPDGDIGAHEDAAPDAAVEGEPNA